MSISRADIFNTTKQEALESLTAFVECCKVEIPKDEVWDIYFSKTQKREMRELVDKYRWHKNDNNIAECEYIQRQMSKYIKGMAYQSAVKDDRDWGSRIESGDEWKMMSKEEPDNTYQCDQQNVEIDMTINKSIDLLMDFNNGSQAKRMPLVEVFCLRLRSNGTDEHLSQNTRNRIRSIIGNFYPKSYGEDFSKYFNLEMREGSRVNSKVAHWDKKMKEVLKSCGLFDR